MHSFQGAGILIAAQSSTGTWNVLLGKRRFNPGRGTWSVPGGKANGQRVRNAMGWRYTLYEGETPIQTALRETGEELRLWSPKLKIPTDLPEVATFRLPFFTWSTFLWIARNPELRVPENGRDHEFEEMGWFHLHDLPEPLHFGVRQAVKGSLGYLASQGTGAL